MNRLAQAIGLGVFAMMAAGAGAEDCRTDAVAPIKAQTEQRASAPEASITYCPLLDAWPADAEPLLVDLRPTRLAQRLPIPGALRWSWLQLRERWSNRPVDGREPVLVIGTGLDDRALARQCGEALVKLEQRDGVAVLRGGVRRFNQSRRFADDGELALLPAAMAWAAIQRGEAVLADDEHNVQPDRRDPHRGRGALHRANNAARSAAVHTQRPASLSANDWWIEGGAEALALAQAQSRNAQSIRDTPLTIPCHHP